MRAMDLIGKRWVRCDLIHLLPKTQFQEIKGAVSNRVGGKSAQSLWKFSVCLFEEILIKPSLKGWPVVARANRISCDGG